MTPVRHLSIKDDDGGKAQVTLWRQLADTDILPGHWYRISHLNTSKYMDDIGFNTTATSAIQVCP